MAGYDKGSRDYAELKNLISGYSASSFQDFSGNLYVDSQRENIQIQAVLPNLPACGPSNCSDWSGIESLALADPNFVNFNIESSTLTNYPEASGGRFYTDLKNSSGTSNIGFAGSNVNLGIAATNTSLWPCNTEAYETWLTIYELLSRYIYQGWMFPIGGGFPEGWIDGNPTISEIPSLVGTGGSTTWKNAGAVYIRYTSAMSGISNWRISKSAAQWHLGIDVGGGWVDSGVTTVNTVISIDWDNGTIDGVPFDGSLEGWLEWDLDGSWSSTSNIVHTEVGTVKYGGAEIAVSNSASVGVSQGYYDASTVVLSPGRTNADGYYSAMPQQGNTLPRILAYSVDTDPFGYRLPYAKRFSAYTEPLYCPNATGSITVLDGGSASGGYFPALDTNGATAFLAVSTFDGGDPNG
jgi:hypothetical protein